MMTRVKAGPEELTYAQKIELIFGPRGAKGLEQFRDDGDASDCYRQHKDELYRLLGEDIVNAWAFRKFEARRLKG